MTCPMHKQKLTFLLMGKKHTHLRALLFKHSKSNSVKRSGGKAFLSISTSVCCILRGVCGYTVDVPGSLNYQWLKWIHRVTEMAWIYTEEQVWEKKYYDIMISLLSKSKHVMHVSFIGLENIKTAFSNFALQSVQLFHTSLKLHSMLLSKVHNLTFSCTL